MSSVPPAVDPVNGTRREPMVNRTVLAVLRSPMHSMLDGGTTALRYPARDGHQVTLPVGFVRNEDTLVVLAGGSSTKRWWRHFHRRQPVYVWWRGAWRPSSAQAFAPGTEEHADSAAAYHRRHSRVRTADDPVVLVAVPQDSDAIASADAAEPPAVRWRAWTGWVTFGEFLGFTVPATAAAVLGDVTGFFAALVLIAAGAVEGALLGAAQAHVLRRTQPSLPARHWVLATSAAAALAWAIGLLPMLTDGFAGWPVAVWAPPAVVLGTILLASIGTAQWLVLRRHVDHTAIWIATTAGAWAAGLVAFTLVTAPLWQEGQPVALVAAIGVLGGLVMAFTVAALTGWAFLRVVPAGGGRHGYEP